MCGVFFKMGDSRVYFFADGKEHVEKKRLMVQHQEREVNCSSRRLDMQEGVGLRAHRYFN